YTAEVMSEMLVALFVFLAVTSFARFLESGRARDVNLFGVWSALAILTKGSGFALALAPLFGIALTRQWRLFLRPALWAAGAIVVATCGPWYALAPGAQHEKVSRYGGVAMSAGPMVHIALHWFRAVGIVPFAFALIGVAVTLIAIWK